MQKYIVVLFFIVFYSATAQDFTTSNLPLLIIDTQGNTIVDEPKITARLNIIDNANKVNNINDNTFAFKGFIGIEIRGNTAQMFEKKSFSFETRTQQGENLNVSLLGLPAENDWVLYGPYSDKSLIRNVLAYHLGNAQGRWSPRTRFCEVFINNEYRGVYVLVEKIKIDKNRVDIAKLKPTDIEGDQLTGGYIMSIDRDNPGSWNSPFLGRTGSVDVPISYVDPNFDDLTIEQREYIKDYITDFEYALHGKNFKDPELGYRPFVDIISFIDYMIMTELSRDLDGYRVSVYFHKDKDSKDGKLVMSPLWDYNLCFGNGNFMQANNPIGWTADGIGRGDWYEIPFWWDRLREDPFYETYLKHRWNKLRNGAFCKDSINAFIDSCAYVVDEAQVRNFQKFGILGRYVWPNAYIGYTYNDEVAYLKSWISDRLDWLDSQIELIVPAFEISSSNDEPYKTYPIKVFPNPFNELVAVRVDLSKNAKVEIIVRNVLGDILLKRSAYYNTGINEILLNKQSFSGVGNLYFYSVFVDGENIQNGKLMKIN